MKCPKCKTMVLRASCNYMCHPDTGRRYGVLCVKCKATVFLRVDGTIEVISNRNP